MEDDDDFEDWLIAREECIMDLDDEELKATRKLNRVDKESSIEEDIKMMYHIIEFYKRLDTMHGNDKCKEIKAVENILSERKADKKRIKELEDDLYSANCIISDLTDSIPVQKVKDKIEELKKDYEDSKDENGETEYYYPDYTIRKLEELLEDK